MASRPERELFERIRFGGNPVAHPGSVVIHGDARFTMLTSRLLRLEWSETGEFEDRSSYAFPTRYAPPPRFTSQAAGGDLILETDALILRHRGGRGRFTADTLSIQVEAGGEPRVWRPGMRDPANLRGTRRTLDRCAGDAALEEGLVSRAGWALFDDSRSVRFGAEDGWVVSPSGHDLQDWYFFGYGHDYKGALADYVRFGGRVPLVPRYVLGAWWSRYWAYRADELKALVRDFAAHGLPLDVLVVDMDWHTPHAWTGYTWNRELFPDPPAFLRWVHDKGLRVTLNLHPALGIQPFEEVYPRFAEAMGADPDEGEGIAFQIADKAFVQNYFQLLHHPMEDEGVDFWWVDWQQGEASDLAGLDPLPWLNHLHHADSARRGQRPMLYSRWGGLGNHRYPIGFSGDTYVGWDALQFQPHFTATASNVAYGWWSHDIGGHMGGATEPELYVRWVQFGALSPCLRLHATKDPRAERRPWKYPEAAYQATKAAFGWRYQLIPYLYTLARLVHDTGVSPCYPMYYEYPEQDAAYVARHQYFLGEQMIAAPLVQPANPETGLAATDVWVPEGTWIEYTTREVFAGPRWVRLVGDLDRIPMLVRAGGILPLAAPFEEIAPPQLASGTSDALSWDRLVLSVFPGAEGHVRLYEDDGITEAYLDGQGEWTSITTRMEGAEAWEVQIAAVEGRCDELPPRRGVEIRLEGSRRPREVRLDGKPTSAWSYDPHQLQTTVHVPPRDKGQPLTVTALAEGGICALGDVHNRRVVRSDVRRLLGEHYPEAEDDETFLEAVLGTDAPGTADALARLGGPLVRVIEFSAPEEASQHLGRVIVGQPATGGPSALHDPYDLEVTWTLMRAGEIDARTVRILQAIESQILDAPFGLDGRVQPARWTVDVRITWRGKTLTHTHCSQPLFPTIPNWRTVISAGGADDIPLDRVMDDRGRANPALEWRPYVQAVDELANVNEPHVVVFSMDNLVGVEPDRSSVAYLATTVRSPDVRPAVVRFWAAGPVQLFLNGQPVEAIPAEPEAGTIHPFFRQARRTEAVCLQAGENHLLAVVWPHAVEVPIWFFRAAIVTPDQEVMTDLAYG
jgi:hypothetical protein